MLTKPCVQMTELDLFAPGVGDWETDPLAAFEAWLAARKGRKGPAGTGLRASSASVYRAQWSAFVRYLAQSPSAQLTQVGEADISRYLAGLHLENRQQRARIRKLIERVLDEVYRAQACSGTPNPARRALVEPSRAWKDVPGNRPTPFLRADVLEQLWGYMECALIVAEHHGQWKEARDLALTVAYLGAGVKVGDSLRLTVNCIHEDLAWVDVKHPGSQYAYRAKLLRGAPQVLARWLRVRAHAGTLGPLLFPGGLDGRPMHSVTALRAVRATATRAGIACEQTERLSPQTLRNTYAATLLAQGETDLALCNTLGFAELVSATRLRAAWDAWRAQPAPTP
ncbi:tyrosine-type recombinase/integrase [Pandoraea sputorum]|uniref:tyrosine-type recombinase/integrase n=1 Tax=Pandoraea sputorum TaxID=93222 RepID=UPI00123F5888|nr:tyrosine-type recombinase/integrase [Pandoraea sputorum]VVE56163.1 Tyrosine recombinase XerD [Pandoraea sputorum]